jgi:hypothetical protein
MHATNLERKCDEEGKTAGRRAALWLGGALLSLCLCYVLLPHANLILKLIKFSCSRLDGFLICMWEITKRNTTFPFISAPEIAKAKAHQQQSSSRLQKERTSMNGLAATATTMSDAHRRCAQISKFWPIFSLNLIFELNFYN